MTDTYETQAKGIRIFPGEWRPHYPWEHIAWVSPSWPCQDYLWLDFPEAIFTDQGLWFLSHINPPIPTKFETLPKVPWKEIDNGVTFERKLPNGLAFGGSVTKTGEDTVGLELFLDNQSEEDLTNIELQTCAFLRAFQEFSHPTMANKYVHVPEKGWVSWLEAIEMKEPRGTVSLGWRGGPKIADRPMIVLRSETGGHCVSWTWFEATNSLIGNSRHPCFHADPRFPDLARGDKQSIRGEIRFYEEFPEKFEDG